MHLDSTGPLPAERACDLRAWLSAVDELDGLSRVKEASSEYEIGAITEMLEQADESPAALFEAIPGFADGFRVLSNAMGTRQRQAVSLGIDPGISHRDMIEFWRLKMRQFSPIEPRTVSSGPVMENVLKGEQVDIEQFPAPIWHPKDGGRYIGTASLNIMRDPDTGIINVGSYRNQVFSKDRLGIRVAPPHHGGIIKDKWTKRGEPCPIVISVGHHPLLFMAACVEGPNLGESEFAWAGGVLGQEIEVIEGEVTGLPIPAASEVALEGFITTDEFRKEGPYGEWTGYYQDGYADERVIRIERIYHRNDPILLGCPQGKPPHEDNRFLAYLRSGMIWDQLERAGVPGVTAVWSPPEGANRLMTVVALDTQYAGHGKQAGLIASQCAAGVEVNRLTVVVDSGVDVTQLKDVMWAVLTRSDPDRDLDVISGTKGARLDMAMGPHERERKVNSRMVIDATTPFHWKHHPDAGEPIFSMSRMAETKEKWGWLLS